MHVSRKPPIDRAVTGLPTIGGISNPWIRHWLCDLGRRASFLTAFLLMPARARREHLKALLDPPWPPISQCWEASHMQLSRFRGPGAVIYVF